MKRWVEVVGRGVELVIFVLLNVVMFKEGEGG